jgi:hypothetical protein
MRPHTPGQHIWPSFGILGGIIVTLIVMVLLGTVSPIWGSQAITTEVERTKVLPESSSLVTRTVFLPVVAREYEPLVPSVFGIQTYGGLHLPSAGLTLAHQARAYWIRSDISWASVEPTDSLPKDYRFSFYDASFLSATQAGFRLIVTIGGNPSWAATYANGPIDKVDIGAFTEFVGTVVERYDGDGWEDAPGSPVIEYWEFYNEPDNGSRLAAERGGAYWGHFGAEYARMLCMVYPVIKAANPRAQVALGGLAYDWFEDQNGPFVREFLDDVLRAGGGNCFDVMNFHYYPAFESVWSPYGPGLSGKVNYLRSKLAQYGITDKPMICTETGWFSGNHPNIPSTPETQSRYTVKLFAQSIASGLGHAIWFSWIDPGPYYGDFGLLTQDRQPKPAFYAYRTAAYWLGRASYQRALTTAELGNSAMEGYLLTWADGKPLYVLWSNDGQAREIRLPAMQAQTLNMYGDTTRLFNDGSDGWADGYIRVNVGPDPVYVRVLQ